MMLTDLRDAAAKLSSNCEAVNGGSQSVARQATGAVAAANSATANVLAASSAAEQVNSAIGRIVTSARSSAEAAASPARRPAGRPPRSTR